MSWNLRVIDNLNLNSSCMQCFTRKDGHCLGMSFQLYLVAWISLLCSISLLEKCWAAPTKKSFSLRFLNGYSIFAGNSPQRNFHNILFLHFVDTFILFKKNHLSSCWNINHLRGKISLKWVIEILYALYNMKGLVTCCMWSFWKKIVRSVFSAMQYINAKLHQSVSWIYTKGYLLSFHSCKCWKLLCI